MAGPDIFRPSDLPTGLQAFWKLDETSGVRADSGPLGNRNPLSDNNTVQSDDNDYWASAEKCAYMDEANSEYLSLTDAVQTGLDFNDTYTYAGWVKGENMIGDDTLFSKWAASLGLLIYINIAGELSVYHNGTQVQSTYAPGTPNGQWFHIAIVWDNPNNLLYFYVNGNLIDSLAQATTPTVTANDITLSNAGVNKLDGRMKDVAIWDRILTPIEIKSLAMGVDMDSFAYRPDQMSGLVSWWKMNEIGATAAREDSQGSNDLAAVAYSEPGGAGFIEGVGLDLEFASGDYLRIADQASLDIIGDITFGAWIKVETFTGATAPIMSKVYTGGNERAYNFFIDSTNKLRLLVSSDGINWDGDAVSTDALIAGRWTYVAARISGTAMTVYIDGKLAGSAVGPGSIFNCSAYFMVGAFDSDGAGTGTGFFDGLIADAFISNVAEDVSKIESLAAGFPLQQSGIVSYWNMNGAALAGEDDQVGPNTLSQTGGVGTGAGQVGTARDFTSGSSQYLYIVDGSQVGLMIERDFSIFAWAKLDTLATAKVVYGKSSGAAGYELQVNAANLPVIQINASTTAGTTALTAAAFTNIAAIYTGATREVWVSSKKEGTAAHTVNPTNNASHVIVGADGVGGDLFDGLLDEVVVATRWFREEEITMAFIKGFNGKEFTSSEILIPPDTVKSSHFLMFKV